MTVTVVPDSGNHLAGYFNPTDNHQILASPHNSTPTVLVLVTEFRGMALNFLFCADVLRPLHLIPLIDFTYKYHPTYNTIKDAKIWQTEPGLVTFFDIWPGNGVDLFLQPWSPHV